MQHSAAQQPDPDRAKFTQQQALALAIKSADSVRADEYFTSEELMDSSITEPPKQLPPLAAKLVDATGLQTCQKLRNHLFFAIDKTHQLL
jgi:hypothetical protein